MPGSNGELEYRQRQSYELTKFDAKSRAIKDLQKKGNELFGVLIRVEGLCAYFYFQEESGIQKWVGEDEDQLFVVDVSDQYPVMPKNVHRSKFYQKQSPRRIISKQQIKDPQYRINRPYKEEEHLDLIAEELDYRLRNAVNGELRV